MWWGGNNQGATKKVSEARKRDALLPKECRTNSTDQGQNHELTTLCESPRLGTGISLELSVTLQPQARPLANGRNP